MKNTQSKIEIARCAGQVTRTSAALTGLFLAGLSLSTLGLAAGAASAATIPATADAAITHALAAHAQTGWVGVIVRTSAPLTASEEAQMTALGADIVRRLPIIRSVAVRVPQQRLAQLARLPFASHLSYDGVVKKTDEFTVGSSEANLAYMTTSNWTGRGRQSYRLTGAGVTVAVLDSGITPVADLSSIRGDFCNQAPSRLIGSVNFSTPLSYSSGNLLSTVTALGNDRENKAPSGLPLGISSSNTYDPCGHGTHVAGIIAGNSNRAQSLYCTHSFRGIAPQANLVDVRVLDKDGGSTVSTVIAGLQWVLQHQNDSRSAPIRVVNLSLGHPVGESYSTDPICQAVEALVQAKIVVVCAAGNGGRANGGTYTAGLDNEGWGTGYGSVQSPGNDPYIITVGATKNMDNLRADDKIATYSSRGPSRVDLIMKPDIIAPGNKVISLDANGSTLDNYAGGTNDIPYSYYVKPSILTSVMLNGASADYFQLSGTSMAAPVVAGAAALMLQANPYLSPDTIKARLMLSADKWHAPDGTADPLTYGAGYLNIPAALASSVVAVGPAASPALTLNADGSISIVMDHALWGSSLWGTGVTDLHALWGTHALWGAAMVGADHALWGTSSLTFSHALWGTSTVGADHALWGCSVWGDHALWGTASTAVDLTSTALRGE